MHAANRGCKNYPCSIALQADWKINRYHLVRLVSSNRDWFAYYRHTTPIFTHSLYVYAGETIMPPWVLAQRPKPCGGNNISDLIHGLTWARNFWFILISFQIFFQNSGCQLGAAAYLRLIMIKIMNVYFIHRTYHIMSHGGFTVLLSEIGRQLVKAPLAAAISPYLISLTHPTHAWNCGLYTGVYSILLTLDQFW